MSYIHKYKKYKNKYLKLSRQLFNNDLIKQIYGNMNIQYTQINLKQLTLLYFEQNLIKSKRYLSKFEITFKNIGDICDIHLHRYKIIAYNESFIYAFRKIIDKSINNNVLQIVNNNFIKINNNINIKLYHIIGTVKIIKENDYYNYYIFNITLFNFLTF